MRLPPCCHDLGFTSYRVYPSVHVLGRCPHSSTGGICQAAGLSLSGPSGQGDSRLRGCMMAAASLSTCQQCQAWSKPTIRAWLILITPVSSSSPHCFCLVHFNQACMLYMHGGRLGCSSSLLGHLCVRVLVSIGLQGGPAS